VTVGVADTGLDYTHSELGPKVKQVVDFTGLEPVNPCGDISDEDLANEFGGPADTDWNGHGSWIGGRIAAALDGKGINGIAPGSTWSRSRSRSGAARPATRCSWPRS
jgi:subtilisin family serine protease